jgi:hypothetical protein
MLDWVAHPLWCSRVRFLTFCFFEFAFGISSAPEVQMRIRPASSFSSSRGP